MGADQDRFEEAGAFEGIILILPSFLAIMAGLVLVPVLPLMAAEFGSTPQRQFLLQVVLTVPSLIVVLFSPIAGIIGDRFGRKKILVAATLCYSACGLAPIFITDIYTLLASRVLLGFFESTVLVLSTTLLGDAFSGTARSRWFGYQIGGGALVAIPLLAGAGYLGREGWRSAFLIYALPLLMAFLVQVFAKERARHLIQETRARSATPFPWAHMRTVCGVSLFASVSFFVLQLQQGAALADIGVNDPALIGGLSAISSIGAPIGAFLFRFIAHRSTAFLLACGFGTAGVGLLGMALSPTAPLMVASILIGLIGTNILLPTNLAWAARGLDESCRARGIGLWQGTFAVGQFVSALIISAFLAAFGSLQAAFLTVGISVLLAAMTATIRMDYFKPRRAQLQS